MKGSFSQRLANKIFKLLNVKGYYENEKNIKKQAKINKKEVNPPVTHNRFWQKRKLGAFNYFESDTAEGSYKVLIYFHGGAFISQPNIFHWAFLKKVIKQTKTKVFFPIYPKAPVYTHLDAYKFLHDFLNIIKPKLEGKEIVFMGDSAGGNISLSFALQQTTFPISKNILLSPCLDLTLSNPEINKIEESGKDILLSKEGLLKSYEKWVGSSNPNNPILSPINSNLENLPPTIVYVGTEEVLYPEALQFANHAKQLGKDIKLVVAEGQSHAYPLHPFKECRVAAQEIINMLK